MSRIDILTPFPGMCASILDASILGRAQQKKVVDIQPQDLRKWAEGKQRTVDDSPYGGGPGMVMKIEPIHRALQELRTGNSYIILMSPQGKRFDQSAACRLASKEHLILICGHYEGVDERVAAHLVDEELSIGDYVVTNGVLPALVVIDAVVRLLPGVLGDEESALQDSFREGILDHPHYTRPKDYLGWTVPEELLSGNHAGIELWRRERALEKTRKARPDLMKNPRLPPPQMTG